MSYFVHPPYDLREVAIFSQFTKLKGAEPQRSVEIPIDPFKKELNPEARPPQTAPARERRGIGDISESRFSAITEGARRAGARIRSSDATPLRGERYPDQR